MSCDFNELQCLIYLNAVNSIKIIQEHYHIPFWSIVVFSPTVYHHLSTATHPKLSIYRRLMHLTKYVHLIFISVTRIKIGNRLLLSWRALKIYQRGCFEYIWWYKKPDFVTILKFHNKWKWTAMKISLMLYQFSLGRNAFIVTYFCNPSDLEFFDCYMEIWMSSIFEK